MLAGAAVSRNTPAHHHVTHSSLSNNAITTINVVAVIGGRHADAHLADVQQKPANKTLCSTSAAAQIKHCELDQLRHRLYTMQHHALLHPATHLHVRVL
jgi:hypothetical protein